jgi:hypothetical protein
MGIGLYIHLPAQDSGPRIAPYVSPFHWELEPRLAGIPFVGLSDTPLVGGVCVMQLPVRLSDYSVPNYASPGQETSFSFSIANLSAVDYGEDTPSKV